MNNFSWNTAIEADFSKDQYIFLNLYIFFMFHKHSNKNYRIKLTDPKYNIDTRFLNKFHDELKLLSSASNTAEISARFFKLLVISKALQIFEIAHKASQETLLKLASTALAHIEQDLKKSIHSAIKDEGNQQIQEPYNLSKEFLDKFEPKFLH